MLEIFYRHITNILQTCYKYVKHILESLLLSMRHKQQIIVHIPTVSVLTMPSKKKKKKKWPIKKSFRELLAASFTPLLVSSSALSSRLADFNRRTRTRDYLNQHKLDNLMSCQEASATPLRTHQLTVHS